VRYRTHNEVTLRLWHDHFALFPVKVHNTWVWLETVKRKGTYHYVAEPVVIPGIRYEWMEWEYELPEIWKASRGG